jgi:hypothetical protein
LEGKILIPNDQADRVHVPEKLSITMHRSENQPRQPLENIFFSAFAN